MHKMQNFRFLAEQVTLQDQLIGMHSFLVFFPPLQFTILYIFSYLKEGLIFVGNLLQKCERVAKQ